MKKITNLTNSPYDLQGVDGAVRLPAFGSIEGEFSGEYLELLEAGMAVRVEDADAGHDGQSAKQGASEPKAKRIKKAV